MTSHRERVIQILTGWEHSLYVFN